MLGGMIRPRIVLFDLDDTLFDHRHSAASALASIQNLLPRFADGPFSDLEREYSLLLEEIHLLVLSGELDLDRARLIRMSRLMSRNGIIPTEPEAGEVARLFRENYQQNRRVVEGTKELLTALRDRDLTIAIVTNNQTKEQEEKLVFTGLDGLVDFMATSEEVGAPKPDPRIFHAALELAGRTPDEAVVVGDSWPSDIIGARNAGIRPVWYNPSASQKPGPETGTLSVAELRSLRPAEQAVRVLLRPGEAEEAG